MRKINKPFKTFWIEHWWPYDEEEGKGGEWSPMFTVHVESAWDAMVYMAGWWQAKLMDYNPRKFHIELIEDGKLERHTFRIMEAHHILEKTRFGKNKILEGGSYQNDKKPIKIY